MMRGVLVGALVAVLGSSCTYLEYAAIQSEYARLQKAEPSQKNLKHMIERPNFAVIGRVDDPNGLYGAGGSAVAIAAFSSRFQRDELVHVAHGVKVGAHFGLDLPEGDFELVALLDVDGDGVYASDEVVGRSPLSLSRTVESSMVVTRFRVQLAPQAAVDWPIDLAVEPDRVARQSLFFPAGTIRKLTDPIFSDEMVTLGLYDPAAFFEQAPTLFYALEENLDHKTPVIFVHGADGSARGFEAMVAQVDRSRFKPWFFHYPSGGDLDQMGELFYRIFLSGQTIPRSEFLPMVIVAHSMGGLVVRKALDRLSGADGEPYAIDFISLATPFGGHPSARGVRDSGMMILPSWRDMDPGGGFLGALYDRPLHGSVTHHLLYAYNNESLVKFGENSDGVVPLSSQLHPAAQQQSSRQLGLDTSHVGVQRQAAGIAAVMQVLAGIETRISPAHLASVRAGGFEPEGDYSEAERYCLRHYGRFLEGLAQGSLEPANEAQTRIVAMLRGTVEPSVAAATAWLKFVANGRK